MKAPDCPFQRQDCLSGFRSRRHDDASFVGRSGFLWKEQGFFGMQAAKALKDGKNEGIPSGSNNVKPKTARKRFASKTVSKPAAKFLANNKVVSESL